MGKLELTVANRNLMEHSLGDHRQGDLCWYFGPMFHWLAENWIHLFHEEHFTWRERSYDASATACEQAMASTSGEDSVAAAQQWYFRHGISAADVGGLFPDIFLRRFSDDVEISWTGTASPFAPDGFAFTSEPGRIYLPVESVARPLWNVLQWVKDNPPALCRESFKEDYLQLASKIERLASAKTDQFQRADISEKLYRRVERVFQDLGRPELLAPTMHDSVPFVVSKPPALAMFGGIDVDISVADVTELREILIRSTDGEASGRLQDLVENAALVGKPWQDGYQLAENLLDDLEELELEMLSDGHIAVMTICRELGIEVADRKLDANSIRGVALAGVELKPIIVVNESSPYNENRKGRRFTVAHELCHILHDQSRAQRLAHISGPWANPAVEQRANAFAAWVLMPRRLLIESFDDDGAVGGTEDVRRTAESMLVTETALVWHLYNLGFIQDSQRESLLSEVGSGSGSGVDWAAGTG